jgi:hypothetical protein
MNVSLWILQGLLAVLYAIGGGAKVFMFDRIANSVASNQAPSGGAWTAVGIFELLCAAALALQRRYEPCRSWRQLRRHAWVSKRGWSQCCTIGMGSIRQRCPIWHLLQWRCA